MGGAGRGRPLSVHAVEVCERATDGFHGHVARDRGRAEQLVADGGPPEPARERRAGDVGAGDDGEPAAVAVVLRPRGDVAEREGLEGTAPERADLLLEFGLIRYG